MLSEIKVIEQYNGKKRLFVDGIEQKSAAKVETEVLPDETTVVKVTYFVKKFEFEKTEDA